MSNPISCGNIITCLNSVLSLVIPQVFFVTFLLAAPSQDVFLLPPTSHEGQGGSILLVHYSVMVIKPVIFDLMTVVRYNHTPIYNCLSESKTFLE